MARATPSFPPPVVFTVAGSDPSGGAGIQADLKTIHQHGAYGAAAITLLTVQNTRGVTQVSVCDPALVAAQIDAVTDDLPVRAAKTGALGSAAVVRTVAERLSHLTAPVVVDPVMVSKHGAPLLDREGQAAVRAHLLPIAAVLTPNAAEAAVLVDGPVEGVADARAAATALLALGPRAVLVKGGHLGDGERAVDVLATVDGAVIEIPGPRVATDQTHGTGCTLSAAVASRLAFGDDVATAVRRAKTWLTLALRRAPGIGGGVGPVDHLTPMVPEEVAGGDG